MLKHESLACITACERITFSYSSSSSIGCLTFHSLVFFPFIGFIKENRDVKGFVSASFISDFLFIFIVGLFSSKNSSISF